MKATRKTRQNIHTLARGICTVNPSMMYHITRVSSMRLSYLWNDLCGIRCIIAFVASMVLVLMKTKRFVLKAYDTSIFKSLS